MSDAIRTFSIPGLVLLPIFSTSDNRGTFTKLYERDQFRKWDLDLLIVEEYITVSKRKVLRGMHFQTPPKPQGKFVTCVSGSILDAVLDLRVGSPTYGRHELLALTSTQHQTLFVPPGCAHGFYAFDGTAVVHYRVTGEYSAKHDAGVRWDSADIGWPTKTPVISARDKSFPKLADFKSPFRFTR